MTQSTRYISTSKNAKPRGATDVFKEHPLLPLHILDYNVCFDEVMHRLQSIVTRSHLSKVGMEASEKLQCWVCRAISARTGMHRNWEQDENKD